MIVCNHCGAENPEGSAFCSLCLARFMPIVPDARPERTGKDPSVSALGQTTIYSDAVHPPAQRAYDGEAAHARERYVSPSDYHSVLGSPASKFHDGDYQNGGYRPSPVTPVTQAEAVKNGILVTLLLSLLYSFFVLCVVFLSGFLVGPLIFAIAGGVSRASLESGITLAYFLVVAYQMAILFFAGYFASRSAKEKGRGWLYGALCVALYIFFWEPLVNLFFSGSIITDTYSLRGIFVALVLMLPMGAFGGWVAERRYMK